MTKIDPRKMALEIAGLRAAESSLLEGDQVFHDPYAASFFSPEEQKKLETPEQARASIEFYNQLMPGANGAIVSRIKFIDEFLKACAHRDFRQVVIIGAGYDTRAYRIEEAKENLQFIEIDHPLTQEAKIETIKRVFGTLPEHVSYIPFIFGQDQLNEKWVQAGCGKGKKTLFIIEGLLMYIPEQAVDGLLNFIRTFSSAGSALVADYFHSDVINGTSGLREAEVLKNFVEEAGSSLMFGLDPENVHDFFTKRGFHNLEVISAPSLKPVYFKDKGFERDVSPMFNFITAEVAPG